MPLSYQQTAQYDPPEFKGGTIGWTKTAETPFGEYKIDFLSREKPCFLVQFQGYRLDDCTTENNAKALAQKHFNKMVGECANLIT